MLCLCNKLDFVILTKINLDTIFQKHLDITKMFEYSGVTECLVMAGPTN